jgi:hypothetical protein
MPPETIIDNEIVTLLYYPESKIIHNRFHKPTFGKSYRGVMIQGLRILKQRQATKWLSDNRELSAVGSENTEWLKAIWAPQAMAAGWNRWAILLPKELIGQMNMKQFIEFNSDKGVSVCVFSDSARALVWLEQHG